MSFLDSIFGGESTKGIKFQKAENDRKREAINENRDLGIGYVNNIIPDAMNSLDQGYRAAIDAARRGPQAQIRSLQNSGQRAQENVLAGMGEFRRAIMGLPSQQDPNHYYQNPLGLRPEMPTGGSRASVPFWGTQSPRYLNEPYQGQGGPSQGASQGAAQGFSEADIAQLLGGSLYGIGNKPR